MFQIKRMKDGVVQYAHCLKNLKGDFVNLSWESSIDVMNEPTQFKTQGQAWKVFCTWRDSVAPTANKDWWVMVEEGGMEWLR